VGCGDRFLRPRIVVSIDQSSTSLRGSKNKNGRLGIDGGPRTRFAAIRSANVERPVARSRGCDNGGCEFGRVRESELALFTTDEVCAATPFPPMPFSPAWPALDPATAIRCRVYSGTSNARGAGCPACGDDLWLVLASFDVTLDDARSHRYLQPDNTIPERITLLPTNVADDGARPRRRRRCVRALAGGPRRQRSVSRPSRPKRPERCASRSRSSGGTPPAPIPLIEGPSNPRS
jgi:hypothetical protein